MLDGVDGHPYLLLYQGVGPSKLVGRSWTAWTEIDYK